MQKNEMLLQVKLDSQCKKDEVRLCLVSEPFFNEFVKIPGRLGERVYYKNREFNAEKYPFYVKRDTLYKMGFYLEITR